MEGWVVPHRAGPAWLLKNTRGSVLLATLFHGATNTFGFLTPGLQTATRWPMRSRLAVDDLAANA